MVPTYRDILSLPPRWGKGKEPPGLGCHAEESVELLGLQYPHGDEASEALFSSPEEWKLATLPVRSGLASHSNRQAIPLMSFDRLTTSGAR